MHCRKLQVSSKLSRDVGAAMLTERSLAAKNRPHLPAGIRRCRTATSPKERASEPNADFARLRVKNAFMFGPFNLSVAKRLLKKGEEALPIGGRALDLLIVLVERAGEVISHKELIARAWPDVTVEKANLRVHIAALRKTLGDGLDGARYISNVAGRGYCFVAAVARSAEERALPEAGRAVGLKGEITGQQAETSIELLRAALEALHSEQHNILMTVFAGALTQGLLKAGQGDEALLTINKAISQATSFGVTFHIAELLRLKAEALAAARQEDGAAAVDCLKESLRVAREQSVLVYELRSATTLARLLSESGQREEARTILAPVYDRFTEECETTDLRDARALLASLG
jgi:DNA-binding winged helix-turn-helix (wHTH) protein